MMSGVFSTTSRPEPAPKNRKKTHHELGGGVTDFECFDGEGATYHDRHRYVLLGFGQDQIEDESGLRFQDIMEFVYGKYRKGVANAGFYLGYDFTQWFASLPENRARMLLTTEGRAARKHKRPGIPPHPVQYDGWHFDILGNKRFRLRRQLCECPWPSCRCEHAPWMYLCDSGGFFQTSLINVINPEKWIDPVVTDEEYAIILEGKKRRASARLDNDMRYYNRLENEILGRVLREVDRGFKEIDIHLSAQKWFGPGQAAQEWMKGKAPRREEVQDAIPGWFLEAARMSYFGGWFEIFIHGIIPGISHEYDVNSAYPAIIAELPCLLHGTYERGRGNPPRKPNAIYLVRALAQTQSYGDRRKKHHIGAMLHRDGAGRITRPLITEGWFWLDELDAAQKAGCITRITADRYLEWCSYTPCNCPPPLRGIADLYQKRLLVGKDTPLGKGAKLVYNSSYGKVAQSVGDPIFGNAIYASRITSGCRTKILEAIATHPDGKKAVAMVATDGVYFLSEHPTLPISSKLGEWSHVEKRNLTLFKPGVYWDDFTRGQIARQETPTFKARGINAQDFAAQIENVDNEFRQWGNDTPDVNTELSEKAIGWPKVKFHPAFSMKTALQALMQNNWDAAGEVRTDLEFDQSANPSGKRTDAYWDGLHRTEPYWFGLGSGWRGEGLQRRLEVSSHPYEKRFGLDDPWSEESLSEFGVTPDGYVGQEYRDVLFGEE